MTVMVTSRFFTDSANAFAFGYARLHPKMQGKRIFSPLPIYPLLFLIFIISILVWYILSKLKIKNEIDLDYYLTKRNEAIVISQEENPGLLNGAKDNIAKLIGIAVDKQVIEQGETPRHIFFILDKSDLDVFTNEVLEAINNMNVWVFINENGSINLPKNLRRIGKIIIFNKENMENVGISNLTLGIMARFLSLISNDGDTNLDHIYHSLPDISTISFSYPIDIHSSLASVIKHQKHLYVSNTEDFLQITNCTNFKDDLVTPMKFVIADTEPFFISFRGARC
jgi:hypothetical protein